MFYFKPVYPAGQVHDHLDNPLMHVAPFVHGFDKHSLMSVLHVTPVHPAKHEQLYPAIRSLHMPFTHGFDVHSFMLISQLAPLHPG